MPLPRWPCLVVACAMATRPLASPSNMTLATTQKTRAAWYTVVVIASTIQTVWIAIVAFHCTMIGPGCQPNIKCPMSVVNASATITVSTLSKTIVSHATVKRISVHSKMTFEYFNEWLNHVIFLCRWLYHWLSSSIPISKPIVNCINSLQMSSGLWLVQIEWQREWRCVRGLSAQYNGSRMWSLSPSVLAWSKSQVVRQRRVQTWVSNGLCDVNDNKKKVFCLLSKRAVAMVTVQCTKYAISMTMIWKAWRLVSAVASRMSKVIVVILARMAISIWPMRMLMVAKVFWFSFFSLFLKIFSVHWLVENRMFMWLERHGWK